MVGFGSLATAMNHGLKGIGWLAIIGIGCAFISAITMLPAIIQLFEKKKSEVPCNEANINKNNVVEITE